MVFGQSRNIWYVDACNAAFLFLSTAFLLPNIYIKVSTNSNVQVSSQPAILGAKDLELRAIYSRSLKSAKDVAEAAGEEKRQGVELYSDDSQQHWDDILKREDIHAVIIRLVQQFAHTPCIFMRT